MAELKKKKPYLQAVIYGVISLGSYILLFTNQAVITDYTTRGGLYTVLPIAAAFYFSFLHGTFASNVLTLIGIEARKK